MGRRSAEIPKERIPREITKEKATNKTTKKWIPKGVAKAKIPKGEIPKEKREIWREMFRSGRRDV